MSVNQNQQINVFNKGMNTDTSDAYLSNEQYRYAENLRFITNTGENSGELRLIEGYKKVYKNTGNQVWFNDGEEIIAVTSIRNLIVMLTNFTVPNKGRSGNIRVIDTSKPYERKNGVVTNPRIIFQSFDFQWDPTIKYSLVTRWESDDNVKLYIADGVHELMSLNIKNNGIINNIENLSDSVNILTDHFETSKLNDGQLSSPIQSYCYYLYNPGGRQSDLSYASKTQVFYKEDGGYDVGENVAGGVQIRIDLPHNHGYSRIRLFRLQYQKNLQQPEILLVCDEKLSDNDDTFTYTDQGSYLQTESVEELLSNLKYRFRPKLIESKGDYLFCANTKDIQKEIDSKFDGFTFTYEIVKNKRYTTDLYGVITQNKDQYGPTLMRGETYRYGAVFYLKDGSRSSVRYLCDVTIPENEQFVQVNGSSYTFTRFGVNFKITIPSSVKDECVGCEIVRCERTAADSKNLFSGLVGCTFRGGTSKTLRYASHLMSLQKVGQDSQTYAPYAVDTDESVADLLMFASPESVYQQDDTLDVLRTYKDNIFLKHTDNYYIGSELKTGHGTSSDLKLLTISNESYNIGIESDRTGTKVLYIGDPLYYENNSTTFRFGEKVIRYNLAVINAKESFGTYDDSLHKIKDFNGVKSPSAGHFNSGDTITIDNDSVTIGDKMFVNWDAGMFMRTGDINVTDPQYWAAPSPQFENALNTMKGDSYASGPVSSGKSCVLFNVDDVDTIPYQSDTNAVPITIMNVVNPGCVPYGGSSESAMSTNTYYSHGDYVSTNKLDSVSIDVYSGDTFVGVFVYNSAHCYTSDRYYTGMYPTVYCVPIESRIDLQAVCGDLYTKMDKNRLEYYPQCMFQDQLGMYYDLVQDKDAYVYNTVYSGQLSIISHTPGHLDKLTDVGTDVRIHYSDVKTNGELVDSWTKFKSMNFLDVDTRYGEITDMRLFKNSLIYWQKNAVGILSVNERTMLQDVNNTNIILGNGDVLQRFDYLSTKYGMAPNQLCDSQSDSVLYWWDEYNRDLVQYPGGQSVQPMKIAKNVSNLINHCDVEDPQLVYDNKYKEILFSAVCHVDNGDKKTLAYNEMIQQFTSVYNVDFQFAANVEDKTFLFKKDNNVCLWNEPGEKVFPLLKYVVNDKNTFTKVYDNVQIGMGESFYFDQFYNGETDTEKRDNQPLTFKFNTTEQNSQISKNITNREYDLRFAVPRNAESTMKYANNWGERMRGRTMQCELTSSSSSTGFSIQYIITKYRISWS